MVHWTSGGARPLLEFLHPHTLCRAGGSGYCRTAAAAAARMPARHFTQTAAATTATTATTTTADPATNGYARSRLNPDADDYASISFADQATLTVHGGNGGDGCISFLRDLFLPDGPPNGGDGGHGGNVYIQAVAGETSLHKLARRRVVRAGRGKHGQGSARNGPRGEDVVITVPVGTVVREVSREERAAREGKGRGTPLAGAEGGASEDAGKTALEANPLRKWAVYPGLTSSEVRKIEFPRLPRRDRVFLQPPAPVYLDLARPTPEPILLAVGGLGGLGNPHFHSRRMPRPVVATRGEGAVSMRLQLELRLLADVGLVGLPNAGKSTLLRAISNSRTRVGAWAFTTLQPNIGTVVLDENRGRQLRPQRAAGSPRFTVADIPGLVEGAHLDRGLGIAFLRHVERAGVLAFVIDLGAGDAAAALRALWTEVGLYARQREDEEHQRQRAALIEWDGAGSAMPIVEAGAAAPVPALAIAGKPWFVVGTKADLPGAQDNFQRLQAYLGRVSSGDEPHPSGIAGAWTNKLAAIPISAIRGHGADSVVHWTVGLLDQ